MNRYILEKTAELVRVGIFKDEDGNFSSLLPDAEINPLNQSVALRKQLMETADTMGVPHIFCDEFHIYYACILSDKIHFLIGPMATQYLNRVQRHEYYRKMNVDLDLDKNMHLFTVNEVFQTTCLFGCLITGKEYDDEELADANHLRKEERTEIRADEIRYDIREDEEEQYRHTYHEERKLLDAVRDGNVEEALKRNKGMDVDIGKLSESDILHWKNVLVIGSTLCARAAIEGGVAPYTAYRISGYYINKGTDSKDVLQILGYRNQAVEELTKLVRELKLKRHTSSYTQMCKDYVRKHYREKIYLEDIAEQLGISSSYLSRLFKKETGENLQDYCVGVRVEKAANLLMYSEESISRIADYVNFPSQSYMGRVFKERKHMTPREFREAFKPREFIGEGKEQEEKTEDSVQEKE